jgi:hypothetical protein
MEFDLPGWKGSLKVVLYQYFIHHDATHVSEHRDVESRMPLVN